MTTAPTLPTPKPSYRTTLDGMRQTIAADNAQNPALAKLLLLIWAWIDSIFTRLESLPATAPEAAPPARRSAAPRRTARRHTAAPARRPRPATPAHATPAQAAPAHATRRPCPTAANPQAPATTRHPAPATAPRKPPDG